MIALVSIAQAYSLVEINVLKGVGTHFMVFIPGSLTCGCENLGVNVGPFAEGVYTHTFDENIVETVRSLPGVRDAAPYLLFRFGESTISGIDIGRLATNTTACAPSDIVKGRYLTFEDKNDVLLEESFANIMKFNVNDTIDAFGRSFRVTGIVNSGIKPAKANMYAPIQIVQEIGYTYAKLYANSAYKLTGPRDINIILVEVADARIVKDVAKAVLEVLSQLGIANISGYNCYIPATHVISISEQTAWIISIVITMFVMLFALKSQFGSVVERTREIGVLKVLGWTDANVMNQIIIESTIQGLIGGAVGCCIGYALTYLIPLTGLISKENLILTVSPLVIVSGLGVALIGGVFAGIFPAWRAVRLNPSEALRHF